MLILKSKNGPTNFAPFPKNPAIAKLFIRLGHVDELGSGMLNDNLLIKEHTDKGTIHFFEVVTFKTIISVGSNDLEDISGAISGAINGAIEGAVEGAVEGAAEGATKGVIEKSTVIFGTIAINESKRIPDFNKITKLSQKTIEGFIKRRCTSV